MVILESIPDTEAPFSRIIKVHNMNVVYYQMVEKP